MIFSSKNEEGNLRNKITVASDQLAILSYSLARSLQFNFLQIFVQKVRRVKIFVFKRKSFNISPTNGEYLVQNDSIWPPATKRKQLERMLGAW